VFVLTGGQGEERIEDGASKAVNGLGESREY